MSDRENDATQQKPFGIKNTRWIIRQCPFRHMVVAELFEDDVVQRLAGAFRQRLGDRNARRSIVGNYDATILPLVRGDKDALFPLLDPNWLSLLAKAFRLEATLEIDGALHSHPSGSRSGWIHNDFNPGWFSRAAEPDEVYLNTEGDCDYKTGKCRSGAEAVYRIRCLTLIYFLENPKWSPGMGGETGIYESQIQPVENADVVVPPRNNTLLAFECTPHSWHSFRRSTFPRNSITLWLHRQPDHAKKQWPHHEPVYWT